MKTHVNVNCDVCGSHKVTYYADNGILKCWNCSYFKKIDNNMIISEYKSGSFGYCEMVHKSIVYTRESYYSHSWYKGTRQNQDKWIICDKEKSKELDDVYQKYKYPKQYYRTKKLERIIK